MGGRRACCLYKSFLQIPVPAGDISGAHRERAGTTLNFTCPVLFIFSNFCLVLLPGL